MKIQPAPKHLLVRIVDLTSSDSRILLPDEVRTNPYGEVLAVGKNCENTWNVGDKLLFLSNGIIEFQQEGERVFIINEGCILGQYVEF